MAKLAPIKRSKFEIFLRLIGCTLKRTKGDHLIYVRPGLKRPVVITADKEVPVFIIRTNLRTLDMSIEEYLNIIGQL
ncbi:MAG: type II toxin-antitoxin system HicA family toxin [Candidatus Gottesmanbacteria bacterium]|jgi:predicted RNA binding protein YcfA (HicA-like mRNA interferase family)|nr:type II toxin-antitoxin system HicA family toxin [Candidatus Gottesmanbacteria bacterium]